MRRRSHKEYHDDLSSLKTGYRRRKAKKKGFGNLPKAKKKIHLNLEMIASTFTWIFKIVVTCLVAFVAVWYWGQRVSTVGDSMSPVLKNADGKPDCVQCFFTEKGRCYRVQTERQ